MGLVKRTYVDGETVITAANLNDIQDEIIQNASDISTKGTYSKPTGGIPKTDLASSVQDSLDDADTALQSSDIDSTLTVAGKAADAKATGDEISGVKNTLSHKADVIYDTASGDIASFPDGADGLPVKDLTVSIEPVQSGTGDPRPKSRNLAEGGFLQGYWALADGKFHSVQDWIATQMLPCNPSTNYVASWGNGYNTRWQGFIWYNSSKEMISDSLRQESATNGITAISPANAAFMVYDIAGTTVGTPITPSSVTEFQLEEGTTPTSYVEPGNIRPISGRTGANVTRTGINVWDEEWQTGFYSSNNGNYVSSNSELCSKNAIRVKPETTYYFKCPGTTGSIRYYNENLGYLGAGGSSNGTFTTPSNCYFIRFNMGTSYGTTYSNDVSINYPSSDHDYHPGHVQTIPISWQSSAGTVYGGTVDPVTGKLVVDKKCVTLTSAENLSGTYQGSIIYNSYSLQITGADFSKPFICNRLKYVGNSTSGFAFGTGINAGGTSFNLWIKDGAFSDLAEATAFLQSNETQICYYLATPLEYTLTAQQLTTLLGENNIWADCGPSTVEYPADTKLYIQKINTPTDDDMIADANIASGKYFIINNNLYLSTAAILAGDPIKPGTNCTATNLAAALNAINS